MRKKLQSNLADGFEKVGPTVEEVELSAETFFCAIREKAKKGHTLNECYAVFDIFIRALAAAEAMENNQQIPCFKNGAGCSHCCKANLIGVRAFEVVNITKAITEMPKEKIESILLDRLKKIVDTGAVRTNDFSGSCVFLNENGACDIYESRPLVCRTYFSKSYATCAQWPSNDSHKEIVIKWASKEISKASVFESAHDHKYKEMFEDAISEYLMSDTTLYEINETVLSISQNNDSILSWFNGIPHVSTPQLLDLYFN